MLRRSAVVAIGITFSVLALAAASDLDVVIPLGSASTLDGVLEEGEWDDALAVLLDDSTTLFMKHADGLLYLGIRAPDMGVGNLFIVRDGEVWVLHSSAALGTAIYEQVEDTWQLKQDFVWRCRGRGFSASAVEQREEFFETEGWLATISYLGTPEDMEYKILLDDESLRMFFVYLPVSNPTGILSWPPSVTQDVIPGPIPSVAHLDLAQWAIVTLGISGAGPMLPCDEPPSGTIAFSSSRDGNTDIYTISADSTQLQRVTTNSAQDLEPCWSPDGSRLAYQSRRPAWHIYTALLDGLDEQAVTTHLSWSPSWSPDGQNIAYSTGSAIQRVSVSGEWLGNLVDYCGNCGRPTWSPNGTSLAFHSNMKGNQDIYVMHLNDERLQRLTDHDATDFLSSWSPEGTHLAFTSDRDGDLEIYTMRSNGTELTRISNHPADDLLPAWSPCGEWIAFVSERDGNREIYVMKSDGSCVRRVTENPGDDMYPAWNPRHVIPCE